MKFNVYPAIDVRAGRVVRLCQGDYERQTTYPADPLELAAECARQIVEAIEKDRDEANVGQVKLLQVVHSISPALARKVMLRF